ncbi:MAG: hypothetical protein HY300_17795 [Verrucomicrobia bacterium]|nr:hypothetical protein [Verrucomicrobiota bacterium]
MASVAARGALNVPLTVQEFSGVPRVAEFVRSGVPIPRREELYSAAQLQLLGPGGAPVQARFTVLGRWGSGPNDTNAPVRWVLVEFPSTVPALGTNVYTLSSSAAGPALAALAISETTTNITVATGPARFEVSKTRGSLLESVWLDLNSDASFSAGEQIISAGNDTGSFVVATNIEFRASSIAPVSVQVDDNGPGRVTIRVEGFHRDSGTNQFLRYVTRLTFFAGQSYVHVHHTFIEGRAIGTGNGSFPDGILTTPFDRAGLRLRPSFSGTLNANITTDSTSPTVIALTNAAHTAAIRQRTPTNFVQGLRYEIFNNSTQIETGQRARQAWLDVSDSTWGLAVSTRDFWRKGPQRLSGAGDGTMTVEFPAEPYTIYQCMGLAEEVLLDFHGATAPVSDLRSHSQGTLKDPLFAVAPAAWYVGSGVFGQLPAYPCTRYPRFDQILDEHYQMTTQWIDEGHAFGLLNYLDMPTDRYFAPDNPHDGDYSGGYYDPCTAQIREFARRGDFRWLRDLAFPQIRHWFTTDCYDVDDTNTVPHNGICPTHGMAHRSDFTGEYQYMESFWDYYYLTGDRRGFERQLQAARTYATAANWRNEFDLGIAVPGLTGRAICQKLNTMIEAYLASGDPALRAAITNDAEDFIASYGTPLGFFRYLYRSSTNSFDAGQAFQIQVIFLPVLRKYYELTESPTALQQIILGPQRVSSYYRASTNPASPGYLLFTNFVHVTALGGTNFTAVTTPPQFGEDSVLYDPSLTALVGVLSHAGALTHNRALIADAQFIWTNRLLPSWSASVWDKPASQQTLRGHFSLAYLDAPETPGRSQFTAFNYTNGRFRLYHQGTLGHTYQLQMSPALTNWVSLSTNTPDASGTFVVDDTNIVSTPFRFYRVIKP